MKQYINYESLKEAVIAFAQSEPQVWPHWWQEGWVVKRYKDTQQYRVYDKWEELVVQLDYRFKIQISTAAHLMGIDIDAHTERVFESKEEAVLAYWGTLKVGDPVFEGGYLKKVADLIASHRFCYLDFKELYELFRLDLNPAYKVQS